MTNSDLSSLIPNPWPLTPTPGLYIHIPFCKTKCPYCDFFSCTDPDLVQPYLEALEAEAQLYRDQFPRFDTLYLGGGTPSWLSAAHLSDLMAILRRQFSFAAESEITLEANPDDVTAEKLDVWRDLGLNRLSLGVQSFDEGELRFLGRRHTASQSQEAVALIRTAGFNNIGLDLIYGLPGQTPAAWTRTLETAWQFAPEHLSCYQLTLAANTPMGQQAGRGEFSLPDDETQREFFLLTHNFLTQQGYLHYEVANFAKAANGPQAGGPCYCRHNRKYWTRAPYLGLGPAAHSFDGQRRWWNFSSIAQYGVSLKAGGAPVAGAETLTPEQERLEDLYLGFRTADGVSLARLREYPGADTVLAELMAAGLLRMDRDRVKATAAGLVVADSLPLRFVD